MAPKAAKGDVLQQKSPAEFFADNRTIAGFDNVRCRCAPTRGVFRSHVLPSTIMCQPLFLLCYLPWCSPASVCTLPFESWWRTHWMRPSPSRSCRMWTSPCALGVCLGHSLPVNCQVHAGLRSARSHPSCSSRPLILHREEISQARLNKMRGVTSHDRIDEELYQDYETEDAKQVCSDRAVGLGTKQLLRIAELW